MKALLIVAFVWGMAPWCTVDQSDNTECWYATYAYCVQVCSATQGCVGCVANPNR